MSSKERSSHPSLPPPETTAYFPPVLKDEALLNDILRRTGVNNLVYALEYGSCVTGDATRTSWRDIIIIVKDPSKFHKDNILLNSGDYGDPKDPKWHNILNKFGFNYYNSHIRDGENVVPIKYAVISEENFIRGCNGTFANKDKQGAFGLYVAGRIQKAALSPLFKNAEKTAFIESAINTARIDGVWYALGFLKNNFSYEELLKTYVSLSYWADIRIEKRNKIQIMIEKNRQDYAQMLKPIIAEFINCGLIRTISENNYEKAYSLSNKETKKRLLQLKTITFLINYIKNPMTVGIIKAIEYAFQKIARTYNFNTQKLDKRD